MAALLPNLSTHCQPTSGFHMIAGIDRPFLTYRLVMSCVQSAAFIQSRYSAYNSGIQISWLEKEITIRSFL